jgi:hypothetical protein
MNGFAKEDKLKYGCIVLLYFGPFGTYTMV